MSRIFVDIAVDMVNLRQYLRSLLAIFRHTQDNCCAISTAITILGQNLRQYPRFLQFLLQFLRSETISTTISTVKVNFYCNTYGYIYYNIHGNSISTAISTPEIYHNRPWILQGYCYPPAADFQFPRNIYQFNNL